MSPRICFSTFSNSSLCKSILRLFLFRRPIKITLFKNGDPWSGGYTFFFSPTNLVNPLKAGSFSVKSEKVVGSYED